MCRKLFFQLTMKSNAIWLTVLTVLIVVIMAKFVSTVAVCSPDYWPCSCKLIQDSNGVNQLVIHCNGKSFDIVTAVFKRTRQIEIHSVHVTVADTVLDRPFPRDVFHSNIVRNLYLSCQSDKTYLRIERDAFFSSKLFLGNLHIDNCDITKLHYSDYLVGFHFLKTLTFSRAKSNYNINMYGSFHLPPLMSLMTLNISHSFGLEDFFFSEGILHLTKLVIDNFSNFTAIFESQFLGRHPFEQISTNGNRIEDLDVETLLNHLAFQSKETLRSISLSDNSLTRLPKIDRFPRLTSLTLDSNKLNRENFSLSQLNGTQLQTLSLSFCDLRTLKSNAFKVGGGNLRLKLLNLDNNNLTRFEDSVFRDLLQQMASQWQDPGAVHVHQNPFDCDCHLAWLIVDNRHLLRHVKGAKCASDGVPFKKLTPNEFALCNKNAGLDKRRSKHP